jgi:hypothetical protein
MVTIETTSAFVCLIISIYSLGKKDWIVKRKIYLKVVQQLALHDHQHFTLLYHLQKIQTDIKLNEN